MTRKKIPSDGRKVNVAVVGLGFMGSTHLRAYLANKLAKVVAVCDAARLQANGVLRGVSGNIGQGGDIALGTGVKGFRQFEELLGDRGVDLVDLCTPTQLHASQTIAALKAGKHVLCEKPLARDSDEARRVLKAAESASGFLMPAMCMRFWPGWSWLKDVVHKKSYGPVLAARFRRMSELPSWGRKGVHAGGALFDLHIHDTDFVNFLFGRPAAVFSSGVISASDSIDHVVTQYHFPVGPAVYAEGSWLLATGFQMAFTIHCKRATLDFDLGRGAEALQVSEHGRSMKTIRLDGGDGYGSEIGYMLECVAKRRRPSIVNVRDGVTALEICEAEEKSVRTGRIVKLPAI